MPMLAGPFIAVPPQFQHYNRTFFDSTRLDPRLKNGDQLFPNHSALGDIPYDSSSMNEHMVRAPPHPPHKLELLYKLFFLTVNEVKDDLKRMNENIK